MVTRLAPTFLRFGSFEIFKPTDTVTNRAGPSAGLEPQMLPQVGGLGGLNQMLAEWVASVAHRAEHWRCRGCRHSPCTPMVYLPPTNNPSTLPTPPDGGLCHSDPLPRHLGSLCGRR